MKSHNINEKYKEDIIRHRMRNMDFEGGKMDTRKRRRHEFKILRYALLEAPDKIKMDSV